MESTNGCISDLSYGSDDENFPFVDYDEYDAQVFKLPNRNLTMLRLKLNFVLLWHVIPPANKVGFLLFVVVVWCCFVVVVVFSEVMGIFRIKTVAKFPKGVRVIVG